MSSRTYHSYRPEAQDDLVEAYDAMEGIEKLIEALGVKIRVRITGSKRTIRTHKLERRALKK